MLETACGPKQASQESLIDPLTAPFLHHTAMARSRSIGQPVVLSRWAGAFKTLPGPWLTELRGWRPARPHTGFSLCHSTMRHRGVAVGS
jgi:hypothetical protein